MQTFYTKFSGWILNVFVPFAWGVSRKVWAAALNEVATLDALQANPEMKQKMAEDSLLKRFPGLPTILARRIIQAAYNFTRMRQFWA
jgi:hypothetical protein